MAGLTQAEQAIALDTLFPLSGATDAVMYSINGTSEWAGLARTAIGATGWAAATTGVTPSVKANGSTLISAAATGTGTVTHYAIASATSGGRQRTDWQTFTASRALTPGDKLEHQPGDVGVSMD